MSQQDDEWNRTVTRVVLSLMVAIPLAIWLFWPDSEAATGGNYVYRHDTQEAIKPGCE